MPLNKFEGWITFSEAAKKYYVDSSTLRKAVAAKRFSKDEYILVGKTYLVKESAMERLYGTPQKMSVRDRIDAIQQHKNSAPLVSKKEIFKGEIR